MGPMPNQMKTSYDRTSVRLNASNIVMNAGNSKDPEADASTDDEHSAEKDPEEAGKFYNNRSSPYAWGVLVLLLLGRITFGWGRKSLPYVYGFKGEGF